MKTPLAKLQQDHSSRAGRLVSSPLVIGDQSSHDQFKEWVEGNFGKLDVLVNNAGLYSTSQVSVKETEAIMDSNFFGTMALTLTLLPIIADSGSIVFVSSGGGCFNRFSKESLREELHSDSLTVDEILQFGHKYVNSRKSKSESTMGWSLNPYSNSKALLNAASRALAKTLHDRQIKVNTCCPGWCRTDMGGSMAPLSAAQGVQTPLKLIALPEEWDLNNTGHFWSNETRCDLIHGENLPGF
eukprot:CAMPEP_0115024676 /NCGR_PEP_ID=MMETSP0216-20121206/33430_1 /TAXON_ID=223996 /ORGANISM="Protocruzia adherens, Strain Boccale" /LENGTH=241 /DNA_ID=CAMNT_0002398881 /DNA_START=141 /DNA_END=866 /DNA_ORIENTATION=+